MTEPQAATATDVAIAIATLTTQVASLDGNVAGLRQELRDDRKTYVQRGEWTQRNDTVNTRFENQGREIANLRADVNSRRAPWWSTWAVALSAGALAWSVFGPTLTAR